MKFLRGILNITPLEKGCVLTLGNFDGIHLGHQKIVETVKMKSTELGAPSAVLFFEPQPREYFAHEKSPARLTTLHEKYRFMSSLGIDYLYCLRFSNLLSDLGAEEFIERILIGKFNVRHLVIGDDFRFGRGRGGSYETLLQYGRDTGRFTVQKSPSFTIDGLRVSSTLIRKALAEDRLDQARAMLGRYYSISGKVVHGQQIGRTIGFPTANISLNRIVTPVSGVYAVTADFEDRQLLGVANIGTRPTLAGQEPRLEVFFFNFHDNLYGRRMTVQIRGKIREEQKFSSLDQLKQQIEQDKLAAQEILAKQALHSCP